MPKKIIELLFYHKKNSGGPGGPRNKALEIAKGDFINITDPDDYRAFDCLEKLYNAAIKYNVDSAYGDIYCLHENGEYYRNFIDPRPYNKILDSTTSFYDSIYLCQSIFKREKIKNIRYVENTDYEDYAFNSEVLMNIDNIVHVKDAIYYYRHRKNSSASGKTDRIYKIPLVFNKLRQNLKSYQKNKKFEHLKWHYKNTINFLLKKSFFLRMPDDFPYISCIALYCRFWVYMTLKQKIIYLCKIITYGAYKYWLCKIFKIEKKEYYKYFIFGGKYKIKILRKHGKNVKRKLKYRKLKYKNV